MKKRDEIIFGIVLIMLGIIFFVSRCAKGDNIYDVPSFMGGLNKANDGTNLRSYQAWELTNMVFKMNALEVRQGYGWLDSVQIDTFEIDAIYSFQKKDGNKELLRVCNKFIYPSDGLGQTINTAWDTTRIRQWTGYLTVADGNDTVFQQYDPVAPPRSRHYNHVSTGLKGSAYGDYIDIDTDTSGSEYRISRIGLVTDSVIILASAYDGYDTALATAWIYKRITGKPSFSTYNNMLYICDSLGFALKYTASNVGPYGYSSGDKYEFLAVLDSGLIDTVTLTTDSSMIYRYYGLSRSEASRNKFMLEGQVTAFDTGYVKVGRILKILNISQWVKGQDIDKTWSSIISQVDTLGRYIETEDYIPGVYNFHYRGAVWGILNNRPICTLNDTSYAVIDTGKNFYDIQFGDDFLTGFFAVSAWKGIIEYQSILCHGDNYFMSPENVFTSSNTSDGYYIFTRLPRDFSSAHGENNNDEFPRFEQIIFYNDQLYAFGHEEVYGLVDTSLDAISTSFNRIWYSDVGYPEYIDIFYNFDVGSEEDITVMFELRGYLYIGTRAGIWRSSGLPSTKGGHGNQVLDRVISNTSIPDLDNWAKSTEEYGYFVNRTGGYRFNGIRAEEFAFLVTPTIKDNYASDIVMGYQDKRLFMSFPDSNFTLLFDERYAYRDYGKLIIPSIKLDFGMTCIYAPPDTDIIYFGHSEYPGRVYYYPNGEYWDRSSPTDSSAIEITYESGWQSLTVGPWNSKKLMTGYFPVQSDTSFHVDIFSDFSATASDTFTSATYGNRAYRIDNLSAVGDYFKTKITATVIDAMIIRPYRLIWQEADMREGD